MRTMVSNTKEGVLIRNMCVPLTRTARLLFNMLQGKDELQMAMNAQLSENEQFSYV